MTAPPPLLAFRNVSLCLDDAQFTDIEDVDLTLQHGECVMIELEDERDSPLVALAIGERPPRVPNRPPMSGSVEFNGIPWDQRPTHDLLACRGRIGLVLTHGAWVSNLSVLDNVLLRTLHHTLTPRKKIETDAQELAYRVGLAEVPTGRLSAIGVSERKRSQWVRAFLGVPELIILQRPCRGVHQEHWEALVQLVRQRMGLGAGVLWLASDRREIALAAGVANRRLVTNGTHITSGEGFTP